jgi:hypothetical protein
LIDGEADPPSEPLAIPPPEEVGEGDWGTGSVIRVATADVGRGESTKRSARKGFAVGDVQDKRAPWLVRGVEEVRCS